MENSKLIGSRYKLLLDSDDYIVFLTPERDIKFANDAYCDFVKKPFAELTGTRFPENEFSAGISRDNPSVATIQMSSIPSKDKWLSWKETGIFDEDGTLVEIFVAGRGVHKDFQVQKGQLVSTLNAFKHAIDSNVICTITDARGTITYANEKFCTVSKYSQRELIGQNHRIVNSGYHPRSFFDDMWRTISSGKMWVNDVKNKAKDGSFYWVQSVIVPIRDEAGNVNGYLSLRTLINDRKQMEEERANYLRSVEDMLYIVSHEIRKPITNCQGLLYVLQNEMYSNKEEYNEIVDNLVESAMQLDEFSRKLNNHLHSNIKTGADE